MRRNAASPWISGCIAAVIFAVIWLLTGGGGGSDLVVGSLLVGAVTTAITYVVRAVKAPRTR